MDELNNLNPNGANNNPTPNSDPYQASNDPNPNVNPYLSNPYEPNNDPYSSLNPDYIPNNESPYDSMNSNPFQPVNTNNMNPDFQQQEDTNAMPNNDHQVINPILSQNIPNDSNSNESINNADNTNDSFNVSALGNQEDSFNVSDLDNQDTNSNNINYQDNSFNGSNDMNYQNNSFNSSDDMNYQDDSFNGSNDMNYQNNMNYQDDSFNNSNDTNYQNDDFNSSNANFSDPNLNYQDNNFNNQGFSNNASSGDYNTEFVKRWMGNIYDKAHSKKFNWCSAIFGPAYFLYRKMYLTGCLLVILSFLITILSTFLVTKLGMMSLAISGVIALLLVIIYGFAFYPLYRNFVRGNLNKLKQTITDNTQLLNEASKKGNTSIVAVILYFIISPIILSLIMSLFIGAGIINIKNAFQSTTPPKNETEIQETIEDLQPYNFVEDYFVTYDALKWFYDDTDNSINKGGYILTYTGQSLTNVSEAFGVDLTTNPGRASLLQSLVSSYEAQAATSNLTVDVGQSRFIQQGNACYAYLDVTSPETIERYYVILIPEDDIMFQFVLTAADTTVDLETNLEVVNILTSIEPAFPSDEEDIDNPTDENIIDDEENENSNSTDLNSVDDEESDNIIENDVANTTDEENNESNTDENITNTENTSSENTSENNSNVTPLTDILA